MRSGGAQPCSLGSRPSRDDPRLGHGDSGRTARDGVASAGDRAQTQEQPCKAPGLPFTSISPPGINTQEQNVRPAPDAPMGPGAARPAENQPPGRWSRAQQAGSSRPRHDKPRACPTWGPPGPRPSEGRARLGAPPTHTHTSRGAPTHTHTSQRALPSPTHLLGSTHTHTSRGASATHTSRGAPPTHTHLHIHLLILMAFSKLIYLLMLLYLKNQVQGIRCLC